MSPQHRLRWRLCKELKKPVDDEMFKSINSVQYTWYKMQIDMDDEEEYEKFRNLAEHNAMFWNPEAVEQVREARKNTFSTDDTTFEQTVKELFGRKMYNEASPDSERVLNENKATPYLDMELDEIKFTPIRGK